MTVIGIDAGGTNLDAALISEGDILNTNKVPRNRDEALHELLGSLIRGFSEDDVDRVVTSTTHVLNAAVEDRLPMCSNITMPGVGLSPRQAFSAEEDIVVDGCIDHRGRETEEPRLDTQPSHDVVAVTAKFSPRNPEAEKKLLDELEEPPRIHALGHESGGELNYPMRTRTTVANAKTKEILRGFDDEVRSALESCGIDAPLYHLKGDAAMLGSESALETPASTLRSGPAASSVGLVALTGLSDAVFVDIGGTTTDIGIIGDGFPLLESDAGEGSIQTYYPGVKSVDLALGGDTVVLENGELSNRREGVAAAYGGGRATLTDAFHVTGDCELGDGDKAWSAVEELGDPEQVAGNAVKDMVSQLSNCVEEVISGSEPPGYIALGGVIAPCISGYLENRFNWVEEAVVPGYAGVAGAVGCAAAVVSIRVDIHIDTDQGVMTVASVGDEKIREVDMGRRYSEDEAREIVSEETLAATRRAGGETGEIDILDIQHFNVVEAQRVAGQIINATAQRKPGLAPGFGGG